MLSVVYGGATACNVPEVGCSRDNNRNGFCVQHSMQKVAGVVILNESRSFCFTDVILV